MTRVGVAPSSHRDHQASDVGRCRSRAAAASDRHQHQVVLVRCHRALALGGERADDLAGEVLDAQPARRRGEALLKSSRRTVAPITQTALLAARSSSALERAAASTFQLPTEARRCGCRRC